MERGEAMAHAYDAIVIGLGAMGSATAYHLARSGYRTLGLDAFGRGHTNGSSHGRTRGIREAYAESPDYVPFVQRAYTLWRELEAESDRHLLTITGGISIGRSNAPGTRGYAVQQESAARYGLAIETLTGDEVMARYPGFHLPEGYFGIYDPHTGFLLPVDCVTAHLDLALRHGATLHHDEAVRQWTADGGGVKVETAHDTYTASRLVITAGPWAGQILRDLGLPLTPWHVYNVYFEPTQPALFDADRFPVWGLDVPEGGYYGVPYRPEDGFKIGRHDWGEPCTPETAANVVTDAEIAAYRAIIETYLPAAVGPVRATATCIYTMTPDGHFIIDRHPAYSQVAYGCGFSGHGFKFSAAVGEALSEIVTKGQSTIPIDFLSAARFAPMPV